MTHRDRAERRLPRPLDAGGRRGGAPGPVAARRARARCWRCSARAAPASRRCCGCSPGSSGRRRASSACYGEDLGKLPARRLARYRSTLLGYADQHYARALAPELTARELVALQLGLRGTPRAERLRRADELLERVGLADKRDRRPTQLSGGEQQRVALCAALAHRPRVFLADEPTGELDARDRRPGVRRCSPSSCASTAARP